VRIVQLPLFAPVGTMMLAGMDATAVAPVRIVNVTVVSDVTGIPNVTFPTALPPPTNELGVMVKVVGRFTVAVRLADFDPPFALAETVMLVVAATWLVTSVKLALDVPAKTVMEAGIECTAELPLVTVRATLVSVGAGPPRVTVPLLLKPPITVVGTKLNADGVFVVTVRVAVLLAPFAVAETTMLVGLDT